MRFQYHFEPKKGWMNDPNGLIYFRGQYHAFFQHNPYAPRWGKMHWGHAVSSDLIHWQELPIALYPDQAYENAGGCYSGSAVEKDGRLYLFYTSVSRRWGQTQSMAYSDDGIHFTKYAANPVISENPLGYSDFRDPKVTCIDGKYYMVVGTGDKCTASRLPVALRSSASAKLYQKWSKTPELRGFRGFSFSNGLTQFDRTKPLLTRFLWVKWWTTTPKRGLMG